MSDGVPTEDASGTLILRVRYILYARDASWPIVDLCPLSKLRQLLACYFLYTCRIFASMSINSGVMIFALSKFCYILLHSLTT